LDGGLFQRSWFRIVAAAPTRGHLQRVRYWDLAASVEGDYTCGVLMSRDQEGTFYIEDVRRGRWSPAERDDRILRTAKLDGYGVQIVLEQEPGSAGKSVTDYLGKPFSRHTLRKRFRTACKVLGDARLESLTIHHGRHTSISDALPGGRNLAEVHDVFGHRKVSITSG
jgi:phage terminase large subunit-like protein